MKKILCMTLVIFFCICLFLPTAVYANAAEPPALIVIVNNAPEDLSISIVGDNGLKEAKIKKTLWETCYAFYHSSLGDKNEVTLLIYGNGESFEQPVDYLMSYNNIFTLDFEKRTIEEGKLLSRSILLVTLRVVLTLIIEGFIFFIFGFRRQSSWIGFLIINLLTQGALNISLNDATPFAGYLIYSLMFMEFFVIIVELIAFLTAVKEHGRGRRALYVLIANLASLFLGGWLITSLPI